LFFCEKSGIDLDLIADDLLSKARELMSEAQSDPNHPIRNKFDVWMLDFAQQLTLAMKIHKPNSESKRACDAACGGRIIQDLLIRSKETITQLQNNETPLMQFLISNLNRMLSDLQKMRRPNRKSTIGSGNYFRAAGEVPQ
jgi:hypothetical protein